MKLINFKFNNKIVKGYSFDKNDEETLKKIFFQRKDLNLFLKSLNSRCINIPDLLSEGLYCFLYPSCVRTNSMNNTFSYDAIDTSTGEGIQIKSTFLTNDCTSFGPTATWDKLIFMQFCIDEKDNPVKIYDLSNIDLSNIVLNKSKNETFVDQQKQNRRPRFSIVSQIILPLNLQPIKIYKFGENKYE